MDTRLVMLLIACLSVACLAGDGGPSSPTKATSRAVPQSVRIPRDRFEAQGGALTSPWIRFPPFERAVVSWNGGQEFELELRVIEGPDTSPWFRVASWPEATQPSAELFAPGYGHVSVDEFVAASGRAFDALQVRLRGRLDGLERVFVTTGAHAPIQPGPRSSRRIQVDVPARSQFDVEAPLGARLCSPTSTAMALAHFGVTVSTEELAAMIFDAAHDVYGNWPRAIAAAAEFGLPGCVARLESWAELEQWLASGTVVVASVTAEAGELQGAPFSATAGHLLVIRGLGGDVLVNDPAAPGADSVLRRYSAADIERVWFERKGGLAYLFGPAVLADVPEAVEASGIAAE